MSTKRTSLYIPQEQTITLWFVREGASDDTPELWVTVRADLTFDERGTLQAAIRDMLASVRGRTDAEEGKETPEPDINPVWEAVAPFVLDWSVGRLVKGKAVKVDPPAIAGGKQFALISETFVGHIVNHLLKRSEGQVELSFLDRWKRTPSPTGNGNASGTMPDATANT